MSVDVMQASQGGCIPTLPIPGPTSSGSLFVRRRRRSSHTNLLVGDAKVRCCMEQLASATPSLHQLLQSDRLGEVRLPQGMHVQAVQSAVEYIAEGKIDASHLDAPSVLECAELFKMDSAKKAYVRSLSETVSTENCIQLRQLATRDYTSQLAARCDAVIAHCMAELLDREDFLSLPRLQANVDVSAQLLEFSTDAGIMERVLPAVVSQLEDLVSCGATDHPEEGVVSLVLLPDFSLSPVKDAARTPEKLTLPSPPKLQSSPARKLILGELMESEEGEEDVKVEGTESTWKVIAATKLSEISSLCLIERRSSSDLCVLNINLCTVGRGEKVFPKSPTTGMAATGGSALFAQMNEARAGFSVVTVNGELLAVGGFNRRGCLPMTEGYYISRNVWEHRARMESRRARFSVVQCKGMTYALGGCDGQQELGSVEVLDPNSQSWRKLKKSNMITSRSSFGAAELDGKIYAIGGSHYSTPIRASEVFNPSTGKWASIQSMLSARSEVSVASCNGRIYAIGGQKSGWKVLSTVESYDPVSKRWRQEANLNTPRRNAAVVTIEDRIFVIGGYDGSKALNSVEVFDPLADEWTYMTPMAVRRSNAAAVALSGTIYVIGGYSGSLFLNSMECFSPESRLWTSFI